MPRPSLRRAASGLARVARPARPFGHRLTDLRRVAAGARPSLVALGLNSSTSLVAGAVLGSITGTFERYPGLLVLVPAAIGLRGNVFSTLGSRLSTALHTGQLVLSPRRRGLLGQNVEASLVLTLAMSAVLAVLAWLLSEAVGVDDVTSPLVLAGISILGGLLGSVVVLAATLVLTWGAVRFRWDLDNVVAPVVSTLGDVVTLPALWLAAQAADVPLVADLIGLVLGGAALVALARSIRSAAPVLAAVTRESWPVLLAAALLSTLAGLALEGRLDTWQALPALLVLQPAFVSSAGALGGILSSRTATALHLGQTAPTAVPSRAVRADAGRVLLLGLPVYLFNGAGAHGVARLLGQESPGLGVMVGLSLGAGLVTVAFALAVGYYGTVAATALRADPDTYGIPVVTSSVDFAGVVALVAAVAALSLTASA
jgi:mgtE-like transporter